jgi:urease accessory protein
MAQQFIKHAALAASGMLTALAVAPAFAHPGAHHAFTGFGAGFVHPLTGWDHLLAMLAIGLWAAQQRRPLLWLLPALFPMTMAAGALAGLAGVHLPMLETGIAASVAVLGLLIAFAVRVPAWGGASLVALFGAFHGYAHGMELPDGASFALYGAGFVLATALLHLAGLASGLFARSAMAEKLLRIAGVGIALTGAYLLTGVV